ncbi:hypothetical protein SARC_13245 [Sphaeroforma arctica JP610]|uniref:NodB homology domain-containing protein n=1 Tax=Sphaeroforma arctica JP610 TaxID=667725 RepID=A0A0L0FBV1_9EUKA|nr:hypothetical protein SARC_13245 [Sphaeroforma arctica JP610]KNC74199.1 hypothetical protein SARC_13245 [Sphaeroforma arctica JP610]|eukprot:XP_014148101.1 hypothetical protein SARC_13245 [Sphaeroforma arctica JP610]
MYCLHISSGLFALVSSFAALTLAQPVGTQQPLTYTSNGYIGNTWIEDFWTTNDNVYWRCTRPGLIAITYDDGPAIELSSSDRTYKALDLHSRLGVPATFFVLGKYTDEDDPALQQKIHDVLQRMVDEGHQIAHHSVTHERITENPNFIAELEEQNAWFAANFVYGDILRSSSGVRYVRPPYLDMDDLSANALGAAGYKVVQRSASSKDTTEGNTADIGSSHIWCDTESGYSCPTEYPAPLNAEISVSQNSWIGLFHDRGAAFDSSITAEFMITRARQMGYRFVTVAECLGDSPLCSCPGNAFCDENRDCFCNEGYTMISNQCVENADECLPELSCPPGSIRLGNKCVCEDGFQMNADLTCDDIDECLTDGICSLTPGSECINTPGSFTCACPENTALLNGHCITTGCSGCPPNADGYLKDGGGACVDIDECALDACAAMTNTECVNTDGSYVCQCQLFWLGPA